MASSICSIRSYSTKQKKKKRKEGRKEERSHQDPDTQTDTAGLRWALSPARFRNLSPWDAPLGGQQSHFPSKSGSPALSERPLLSDSHFFHNQLEILQCRMQYLAHFDLFSQPCFLLFWHHVCLSADSWLLALCIYHIFISTINQSNPCNEVDVD